MKEEKWIIDGNYPNSLDKRLQATETVIFLDMNWIICFYRVFKRIFEKGQPFDKTEGNFNGISWDLVEKLIHYSKRKRRILVILKKYVYEKKIITLKNDREVEAYLSTLVK